MSIAERRGLFVSPPIRPVDALRNAAAFSARDITTTAWYKERMKQGPIHVGLDLPDPSALSPEARQVFTGLSRSLQAQGHDVDRTPTDESGLIFGYFHIPSDDRTLLERIPEVPQLMVREASKRYGFNDPTKKNYVAITFVPERVDQMPKRELEGVTRAIMIRSGSLKVIMVTPDRFVFGTMEGGAGNEQRTDPQAIDKLRDRLVTHACAREAGSFIPAENVVSQDAWQASPVPDNIARAYHKLGEWGLIAGPYDIAEGAKTTERANMISRLMGYSRQSESAAAVWDPLMPVADAYRMGEANGALISTGTGRIGFDKRQMNRDHTTPVAIVPKDGEDKSLYGFERYALGIQGRDIVKPSIEFDEMAGAIGKSPLVRVARHPSGRGWKLDPEGSILLPRTRAFLHLHLGVSEIAQRTLRKGNYARNTTDVIEYIPPNLKDFPYPVGCGKDIQFAASTDAMMRSEGAQDLNSGIVVSFFDALNHGTNFLVHTEPLPGTDFIPDDALGLLVNFLRPGVGPIVTTEEIAQI